jgi:hypothetical protein
MHDYVLNYLDFHNLVVIFSCSYQCKLPGKNMITLGVHLGRELEEEASSCYKSMGEGQALGADRWGRR